MKHAPAVLVLVLGCDMRPGDDAVASVGQAASVDSIRILAGRGPRTAPFIDSAGNRWDADLGYDSGATLTSSEPVTGTADDVLFQGERWASREKSPKGFTYEFAVPSGDYAVMLAFAETRGNPIRKAGQRRFDVFANGAKVIDDLDIFAEVGLDVALEKRFTVASRDGKITLRFAPGSAENPKVNAIAITPATMHPITPSFFGIHLNVYGTKLDYGAHRLWDAGVGWWALQTGETSYDFKELKRLVAKTKPGVDLMYTFGHTPPSIARGGFACPHGGNDCSPPVDVGGSDEYVKAFWREFMKEMCTGTAPHKTCGPFKYFEMWNEANTDNFFSGTYAELARMSADATQVIKENCQDCMVLAADVSCGGDGYHANNDAGQCDVYMANYLEAWQKLGHLPDAGAWHPYPSHINVKPSPFPETNASSWDVCVDRDDPSCTCKAGFVPNKACRLSIVEQIDVMRRVFDAHGLAGKPMFATEGGWNADVDVSDVDRQGAYVARWFITQAGAGVAAAYWYAQDNPTWGTLVDESGQLNEAGRSYNRTRDWLVGSRIGRCSPSGSLWSCPLVRADGTRAKIMWDTALSCSGGRCATQARAVDASFTQAEYLDGDRGPVTGGTVPVGAKPLMVF